MLIKKKKTEIIYSIYESPYTLYNLFYSSMLEDWILDSHIVFTKINNPDVIEALLFIGYSRAGFSVHRIAFSSILSNENSTDCSTLLSHSSIPNVCLSSELLHIDHRKSCGNIFSMRFTLQNFLPSSLSFLQKKERECFSEEEKKIMERVIVACGSVQELISIEYPFSEEKNSTNKIINLKGHEV